MSTFKMNLDLNIYENGNKTHIQGNMLNTSAVPQVRTTGITTAAATLGAAAIGTWKFTMIEPLSTNTFSFTSTFLQVSSRGFSIIALANTTGRVLNARTTAAASTVNYTVYFL